VTAPLPVRALDRLIKCSQKYGKDRIAGRYTRLMCHGWTTSGMRQLVIRRNYGSTAHGQTANNGPNGVVLT
jgi:hypothetical protein